MNKLGSIGFIKASTLFFVLTFLFTSNGFSQIDYGSFDEYSAFDIDYIQEGEVVNYRVRKKGDRALGLYYYIPFDLSVLNEDIINDSTTIIDNQHRVTEKLIPNMKHYISDKANLVYGIYLKRSKIKYDGEIDTTITPSLLIAEKEVFIQTGCYGRIGYEYHFAQPSYRKFDIDMYGGFAGSFGYSPSKSVVRSDSANGNYSEITLQSKGIGLGLDLYSGINFQFDNFSAGLEIIAFGFDTNRGVGKSKVKTEVSIDGEVETLEYYTYDVNPGVAYSKLTLTRNLSSMYRGVRFSVCYYF